MSKKNSATQPTTEIIVDPDQPTLVIKRVFNAPRKLVFEAWTKPEHVRRWYGLQSMTMPVCEIDLRVGGRWRYVISTSNGEEYGFSGEYREIVPGERLIYTEGYEAMPGTDYLVTTTFDEKDGKTTLTSHLLYKTKEHRDGHIASGMEPGVIETYARLDEHLELMPREIVKTRIFDAPRERVWQVWTEPKHVAQWWGPNGFTNTIHTMDVRPGGVWEFIMHGPDGTDFKNKIIFTEVVEPQRLAYEHVSGPKFRAMATFEARGDKTKLTMQMLFETAAEREKTATEFGAVKGLQQTLNRLGDYLAALS